jgi:hypothetical protein
MNGRADSKQVCFPVASGLRCLVLDDYRRVPVGALVEVKRSTDTRIRREVFGQMLDYAANSVAFIPAERIRSLLKARCARDGLDPDQEVAALTGSDDVEDFWGQVAVNLDAGRIRLLLVADSISVELRRIIEFWNRHTEPVELLGVEVRQFVGEDLTTLVPQVCSQTVEATRRRRVAAPGPRVERGDLFRGARGARD